MADEQRDELALIRQLREQTRLLETENRTLKTGGGGGTSGPMEPQVSLKEYVDMADEAVETRLVARMDKLLTKTAFWGGVAAIIGGVFTGVAIILATMAFGGDRFDAGIGLSPVLHDVVARQQRRDESQDRKFDEILRRLPPPAKSAPSRP